MVMIILTVIFFPIFIILISKTFLFLASKFGIDTSNKRFTVSASLISIILSLGLLLLIPEYLSSTFDSVSAIDCFDERLNLVHVDGEYREVGEDVFYLENHFFYDLDTGKLRFMQIDVAWKYYQGLFDHFVVMKKGPKKIVLYDISTPRVKQPVDFYDYFRGRLSIPASKVYQINYQKVNDYGSFTVIAGTGEEYPFIEKLPHVGTPPHYGWYLSGPTKQGLFLNGKQIGTEGFLKGKILTSSKICLIAHQQTLDKRSKILFTALQADGRTLWKTDAGKLGIKKINDIKGNCNVHNLILVITGLESTPDFIDSLLGNTYLYIYNIDLQTGQIRWKVKQKKISLIFNFPLILS